MIFTKKTKDMSKYENRKFACIDLELILTQKCNLACEHCMRGECSNKEISEDVLDETFKKFVYIDNLALGGGEIALTPHLIKMVTEKLKDNDVVVHHANFTSNGTIVSEELLNSLKELEDYIKSCDNRTQLFKSSDDEKDIPLFVCFSFDDYHLNQIIKKGITLEQLFDNIAKYQKVFGLESIECRMDSDMDIYDAGRAKSLPKSANKVPLSQMLSHPYPFVELTNGAILLGNIITISCDGEIIPANIPFANEKLYSFGNIKEISSSKLLSNLKAYETDGNGYNKARIKMYNKMTAPKSIQRKMRPMLKNKLNNFYYLLHKAVEKQYE